MSLILLGSEILISKLNRKYSKKSTTDLIDVDDLDEWFKLNVQ